MFLTPLASSSRGICRHTQLATISKCLSTVFAFVSLVTTMTSLMPIQGGLPCEVFAAHRAPKIPVYRILLVEPLEAPEYLLTITMCQKMPLKLGLLREGLIWAKTSLPATVVSMALGAIQRIHMAGYHMILQGASLSKSGSAAHLDPIDICCPPANVQIAVLRREIRACQD